VLKLREAIGDSAENPRFIETVPRRGYRFIAPVTVASTVGTEAAERSNGEPAAHAPASRWRLAALGVGAALAGAALVSWLGRPRVAYAPLVRFTIALPPGLGFSVYNSASVAFSHDGTRVAYSTRGEDGSGIYVRPLEGLEAVRLPGTEHARSLFFPGLRSRRRLRPGAPRELGGP
jgi:hypothetical protein